MVCVTVGPKQPCCGPQARPTADSVPGRWQLQPAGDLLLGAYKASKADGQLVLAAFDSSMFMHANSLHKRAISAGGCCVPRACQRSEDTPHVVVLLRARNASAPPLRLIIKAAPRRRCGHARAHSARSRGPLSAGMPNIFKKSASAALPWRSNDAALLLRLLRCVPHARLRPWPQAAYQRLEASGKCEAIL